MSRSGRPRIAYPDTNGTTNLFEVMCLEETILMRQKKMHKWRSLTLDQAYDLFFKHGQEVDA